jgi:hypothetical protein
MANARRSIIGTAVWILALGGLLIAAVVAVSPRGNTDFADTDDTAGASRYDPRRAGEPLPPDFRQVLPRDAIKPIYSPRFVPAADSGWHDDVLVIGVENDGIAKAYPVSLLNRREIVNDQLAQLPILVTW